MLLPLLLAIVTIFSITTTTQGLQWEPLLYRQFRTVHNLSPASVDTFEAAVKRERPSAGYGWEQCEFSPMSCLLRRRRRVIDSQQSRMA